MHLCLYVSQGDQAGPTAPARAAAEHLAAAAAPETADLVTPTPGVGEGLLQKVFSFVAVAVACSLHFK